jgi:hypothetical protein
MDRPNLREPFARLLCKEVENYRHRIGGFCCSGVVLYRRRRVGNSTVLRNLHGFLPPAVQTVSFARGNEPQREDLGVKIFASHTQTQP